jgi:hypothetical protein
VEVRPTGWAVFNRPVLKTPTTSRDDRDSKNQQKPKEEPRMYSLTVWAYRNKPDGDAIWVTASEPKVLDDSPGHLSFDSGHSSAHVRIAIAEWKGREFEPGTKRQLRLTVDELNDA